MFQVDEWSLWDIYQALDKINSSVNPRFHDFLGLMRLESSHAFLNWIFMYSWGRKYSFSCILEDVNPVMQSWTGFWCILEDDNPSLHILMYWLHLLIICDDCQSRFSCILNRYWGFKSNHPQFDWIFMHYWGFESGFASIDFNQALVFLYASGH